MPAAFARPSPTEHALSTDAPPREVARALLEDGSLALRAEAGAWGAVEPWMPRIPAQEPAPRDVRACIHARPGGPEFAVPAEAPALELRNVHGWVRPNGTILLHGPEGRVSAAVDPSGRRAEVRLRPGEREGGDEEAETGVEIFAALTLASAFLLGRLERTLVHAAAVAAPGGPAWLLAGGTFSGKTTTCVNLIRAGWDYLADDHVVLGRAADGGVAVEGWPRRFNLDHGYAAGASLGVRGRVDPHGFGPGRWRPSAPLAGVLFPRVQAELPTALAPMHPAGALSKLLQQSPWLLADAGAAPGVLALLRDAAGTPARELRLGDDTYRDPGRLRAVLEDACVTGSGSGDGGRSGMA
ncbi:MAG: hypothetical protein JWM27_4693 [Gemmatimonadetes bacterium]|nr:hypothetical protein [Gemmatimonadota bacterium]